MTETATKKKEKKRVEKKSGIEDRAKLASNLDRELIKLLKAADNAYLDLSQRLFDLHDQKLYSELGFGSFNDYVEQKLTVLKRKAMYLVSVWRSIVVESGVSAKVLKTIPWSKAKEIARVVTKETAERWVEEARTRPLRELSEVVKKEARNSRDKGESKVRRSFVLEQDVADVLDQALDIAGELAKTDVIGKKLDMILMEFLSNHARGSQKQRLDHYVKMVEEICEVEITGIVKKGK